MELLPASLWHRVFRCLLLPPGSSHPDTPPRAGQAQDALVSSPPPCSPQLGRNLPVKSVDPDFSAVRQHRKNVETYGSGWALLCCALASKKLRNLVLSFSAQHPISLVYDNLHPQSLALTYTHVMQLDTIVSQDEWSFASLSLKLRGFPDFSQLFDRELGNSQLFDRELGNEDVVEQGDRDDTVQEHWSHYYGCPRVQRLKLGRGKWVSLGRVGGEAQGAAQFDSQANRLEPCGLEVLYSEARGACRSRCVRSGAALRSLGIVVESEERFARDLDFERRRDDGEEEVTVEECQERNQRQTRLQQHRRPQQQWQQEEQEEEEEEEQAGKLPVIKAPNLKTIFFPTRTYEQQTLVALRESCPSLALYCIASHSFYWEKHGKGLAETETPVVHVRKGRSGVSSNCFGERQAKNVREKMHGVNRELVEGYNVDKDEAYMLKYKGSLWETYRSYYL
ncbi:unnamed protein product [Closterium sp. NIES-64]|nr:unnamed protein product [Closterium sp. NIES-64]